MSDQQPDFLGYTDEQIRDYTVAEGLRLTGYDEGESPAPVQGMLETFAMLWQQLWRIAVRPIIRHLDPRIATGYFLRLHGVWAGVAWRATARSTQGYIHISSATGGTLAEGAVVQVGGQRYTVDTEVQLAAGVAAAVAVTAVTAGAASNVAAGSEAEMEGETEPADATAELRANWVTIYGYDADTDDDKGTEIYRTRVLAGLDVRGEAHTEARYRLAAIGVPGVNSVKMVRTPRGYGSTDLAFLVRGNLPTQADIELVEAALEREALVCRDLWVRAPEVITVAVEAEITGTATTARVQAVIEAWWRQNIGIGDSVTVRALYRATDEIEGLDTIEFSSPLENIDAIVPAWLSPSVTITQEAAT